MRGKNKDAAVRKQYYLHRGRTWPAMLSLEPPWKVASMDTSHSLIRGPWGRKNFFKPKRGSQTQLKSDTAANSVNGTSMKRRILGHRTRPDQRPLRLQKHYWKQKKGDISSRRSCTQPPLVSVFVTGNKFIAGVVVAGNKFIDCINTTGDHWKSVTRNKHLHWW